MKPFISFLCSLFAVCAMAQTTPDIRIKTSIYEKDGSENSFTLVLGAASGKSGYARVKCSGGIIRRTEIATAEYDAETTALVGTNVPCRVDENGLVEVFCDEGVVIDYLSCTGAEITSIEFKNPEAMEILALEHNILQGFDLTPFQNLKALYLNDNPMSLSPLCDHGKKPAMQILEIAQIDNIDHDFDIVNYPNLVAFDAMGTYGLKKITPAACPRLQRISIDNTSVETLDVSQNPDLYILNISESRIKSIDLSKSAKLQQFYATHSSARNTDIKLSEIDLTHCPELVYLFLNGNNLTTLDISKCTKLQDLYIRNNYLTSIDLSRNPNLVNVFISGNCMDFNSLPIPSKNWADCDYAQRPLHVPHSYLVGSDLDLASRIVRDDAETLAEVYTFSEDNPELFMPIAQSKYSFKDGILTIHEEIADSVFAAFYNSVFPDIALKTKPFKVKNAGTFGKDDKMIVINNTLASGTNVELFVGMIGATSENPKTFYVQFGSSAEKKEFISTTEQMPETPNASAPKSFGTVTVYVPEGEMLSAFKMTDQPITGIDLSACRQMKELALINTQLPKLDLQWNRALESLELTGNNFGESLTLAGANGSYTKNVLTRIVLSNNNMTKVKLNEPDVWRYIDLSHNHLSTMDFTDADYVQYLDLSHNDFDYLKINYLGELKTFYCNDNALTTLVLPETNVIETMNCANNCFTLATMPDRNGLDEAHFIYAPQAKIDIPSKGPGYNLGSQDVTVEGKRTVFTWKTTDGETLTNGADYTCMNGATLFGDNTIGKTLYCEITHAAYPQFVGDKALTTTPMLSAGMPTHLLGSFKTPVGGQQVRLALTSAVPNNSVFIDWSGTNSLEQYSITNTSYTLFSPTTVAGANVKVWSYDEDDNLTVFSVSGAKLADVDCSPMKNLVCLTLSGSGISSLGWPESPNLAELSLDGCAFSDFDFSRYPKLVFVNLDGNQLESVNLSGLTHLGSIGLARNRLKQVTFGGNKNLWGVALTGNLLDHIDFTGAPNISQVFLNDNHFSQIDLSPLKDLRVVYLDNNKFDFSTLPIPQEQWTIYTYGNQPELKVAAENGVVDLSLQAERDGVQTEFIWFYGEPTFDSETGELVGELLMEDDEYRVENGVTTFLTDLDRVCGVLTNELFPNTYLKTNVFSVTAHSSGIEEVTVSSNDSQVYNLQGILVTESYRGIVLRKGKKVLQ